MAKRRDQEWSEDDKPWTEAQWEAFMIRADLRVERQLEIRETLKDDPDHHAKLAKEMGWLDEEFEDDDEDEEWSAESEEGTSMIDELNALSIDGMDEEMAEQDRQLEANPAKTAATRLSSAIMNLRKADQRPPTGDGDRIKSDHEEAVDEAWQHLFTGALVPGAKLAGAYGIGFERESICGAIVNLRRGLTAARAGAKALALLESTRELSIAEANRLKPLFAEMDRTLVAFINELRDTVDWDPDRPAV
jgi:hypothetical protein